MRALFSALLLLSLGACSDPAEPLNAGGGQGDTSKAGAAIIDRTYGLKDSHVVLSIRTATDAPQSFELSLRCPRVLGVVEPGGKQITIPTIPVDQPDPVGCTADDLAKYDDIRRRIANQGALVADSQGATLYAGDVQVAVFQPESVND